LGQDFTEYLQEEGRLLPSRYELESFLTEVDRLRDDGERLAARVNRLRRHLQRDHE
jgi:ubiquinone biosynthesis protein UbiJ